MLPASLMRLDLLRYSLLWEDWITCNFLNILYFFAEIVCQTIKISNFSLGEHNDDG